MFTASHPILPANPGLEGRGIPDHVGKEHLRVPCRLCSRWRVGKVKTELFKYSRD